MKHNIKISVISLSLMVLFSCDSNETYVINTVHTDGSISRKVEIRTDKRKNLETDKFKVPIDSTWEMNIRSELNENNDSTWILSAEKDFASVAEINTAYANDSGKNSFLNRSADFSKHFKWFTTVFRFTETIESILTISCPMSDFLSDKELKFTYLPADIQEGLKNGKDSIIVRTMSDSIEDKLEKWMWTCEIRQWIEIFYDLFGDTPGLSISKEEMLLKEQRAMKYLVNDEGDDTDDFFKELLGEDFLIAFNTQIDSALSVLEDVDTPFWSTSGYNMEIRMPGKIIASNGYAKSLSDSSTIAGFYWTVDPVYFLSGNYTMWAESRVNNYTYWIITFIFLLFVVIGFIRYSRKD